MRVPNVPGRRTSAFEATILLGILLGPLGGGGGGRGAGAAGDAAWGVLDVGGEYDGGARSRGRSGTSTDAEDVWSFSPLIDLSIYRWVTRNLKRPHLDRQILLLMLITAMSLGTSELSRVYPRRFFDLQFGQLVGGAGDLFLLAGGRGDSAENLESDPDRAAAGGAVAGCCWRRRMDALQRQINPHFSIQYAELDYVAGAFEAGAGAGDDREAGKYSAGAAEGSGGVRATFRKSWRLRTITWISSRCGLARS